MSIIIYLSREPKLAKGLCLVEAKVSGRFVGSGGLTAEQIDKATVAKCAVEIDGEVIDVEGEIITYGDKGVIICSDDIVRKSSIFVPIKNVIKIK